MDIKGNTERFIKIVNEVIRPARPDDDWDGLLDYLAHSDFYQAPASTMFHNACIGGLCDHVLHVYDAMVALANMHYGEHPRPFNDAQLAIVALFHDISKVNYYILDYKNKKHYYSQGSKSDSLGRYDWITEEVWARRDLKDRFSFGTHEQSSVFILERWVALAYEEMVAILHHTGYSGGPDFELSKQYTYVFSKYPLASLLHLADTYSSFMVEQNLLLEEGK